MGMTVESEDTDSGLAGSFFFIISASLFWSIVSTGPLPPELAPLVKPSVLEANGLPIAASWGRREMVHSCERSCWRIGELAVLNVGWEAVFSERRMLREAPERSMVTVLALNCSV